MENSFWALRMGRVGFKVLAWISAVLGLIMSVALFAGAGGAEVPRWAGVVWIAVGALYFFFFYVLGQGISLLFEIHQALKK